MKVKQSSDPKPKRGRAAKKEVAKPESKKEKATKKGKEVEDEFSADLWASFDSELDTFLKRDTDAKFPELYGLVSDYVVGKELKSDSVKDIKYFLEFAMK